VESFVLWQNDAKSGDSEGRIGAIYCLHLQVLSVSQGKKKNEQKQAANCSSVTACPTRLRPPCTLFPNKHDTSATGIKMKFIGFEAFREVIMKCIISCHMRSRNPVNVHRRFGGTARVLLDSSSFLAHHIFDPEDGGKTFLRHICHYGVTSQKRMLFKIKFGPRLSVREM
jgi:hypothetical protein